MCGWFCNYDNFSCHKHFIVLWVWGEAEASVEMKGDNNKSVVHQSAGLHLIEVKNSGGTSGECDGSWSYAV